jgi:RNA polymerase sigma factor (sigma-70 family)
MSDDHDLLRAYAASRSEPAFAQLVSRHLDFVYATALRLVAGDTHLAQDIAQTVFIDLARKAPSLLHQRSLEAWLYQATRFAAAKTVRTERRRAAREQKAFEDAAAMDLTSSHSTASNPAEDWDRVAPVLDDAIEQLTAADREAILLRFFARKNLRAIGETVGTTEDAARKRISRALEKLRAYLQHRGVNISETALVAAFATGVATVAPPAFAATVTSAALAAPIALTTTATVLQLMTTAKTKIAIATLGLCVSVPLVLQHQTISKLKTDNETLHQQLVAARSVPAPPALFYTNAPLIFPEQLELLRLRDEITTLRRENQQRAQAAPPARTAPVAASADSKPDFVQWAETILTGPPEIQGTEGGNIRRKFLSHEQLTEGEQTVMLNLVRRAADIEKSPDDFTAFQSSFVSTLLNWQDDPRSARVKEIIQNAATAAHDQQMNFNAPALNADSWPPEQKQLNRRATGAIQSLLTQEEREIFDRAFLGIMGIDFGISVGPRENTVGVDHLSYDRRAD